MYVNDICMIFLQPAAQLPDVPQGSQAFTADWPIQPVGSCGHYPLFQRPVRSNNGYTVARSTKELCGLDGDHFRAAYIERHQGLNYMHRDNWVSKKPNRQRGFSELTIWLLPC